MPTYSSLALFNKKAFPLNQGWRS